MCDMITEKVLEATARRTYAALGFFAENCGHPIFEGGRQPVGMVYLRKNI